MEGRPLSALGLALVATLGVLLAVHGFGRDLLALLLPEETESGAWFDRVLLGVAGSTTLAGMLAAVGWLKPWLLAVLVSVAAARGLWVSRRWRPEWPARGSWWLPAGLAAAVVGYFGSAVLVPVFRHDDLAYHLLLPHLYLEAGGWVSRVDLLYANMPHAVELFYTWPLAVSGWHGPAMFGLGFTALVLVRLWGAAAARVGRFAAGLLVLAVVAGRNVQWHLGPAHVEPVLGGFLLGAVLILVRWRSRGRRPGELVVLGIYLGFVAASKYTMWPFVAFLGLVAPFVPSADRTARRMAGAFATLLAVGVLMVGPWLVKNELFTGNPVYPNLYEHFGGTDWSQLQTRQATFQVQARAGGPDPGLWDRVSTIWRLPLGDNDYNCPSFSISLMLLFLAALIPIGTASDLRFVAPLAVVGYALWASGFTNGRYLLPLVPLIALAGVPVLERLRGSVAQGLALAGILLAAGYQWIAQGPPPTFPAGALRAGYEKVLTSQPAWVLAEAVESTAPDGGGVLAMWENRTLFLDRPALVDGVYEAPRGLARLREHGDPSSFAADLARRRVTHVVIHAAQMRGYLRNREIWAAQDPEAYPPALFEEEERLLRRFVAEELVLLREVGPWGIFELGRPSGEVPTGT